MWKKWIPAVLMLFVLFTTDPACSQTGATSSASNATVYRLGATYLAQGWNADDTEAWYHISQGTVFMPAEWFAALEQATSDALFAAPDHLARLGFLPDPRGAANPLGLPVGFAIRPLDFPDNDDLQHYQNWKANWVGFTCAACHTGELNYQGQKIRIDGGPAHIDVETFGDELGAALIATSASAPKFARFAGRVIALGAKVTPEQLQQSFSVYLHDVGARNSLFEAAQNAASQDPTRSGLGRLDAVHRGGNLLLASPLGESRNYTPTTAPVRYPMVWDTPYFDWVLYNASIRQPMARNVVEDLGVGAPIIPGTLLSKKITHGVLMDNLVQVHRLLSKLRSPAWPEDIFGKIDQQRAAQGRAIFAQHCQSCHDVIDPVTHRTASVAADAPPPTITVGVVPLESVGTDPRHAVNFASRMVNLEKIGGPAQIAYTTAAQTVSGNIVEQWAAQSNANAKLEREVDTGRPNDFRGPQGYRARPLNGLWAAPPYLHNGAVPSLYELLQPPGRRTRTFYVGSWEFDPHSVGLQMGSRFPGAFLFDTRLPGNSNGGHSYGTDLSEEEKAALIEYIKTL